MKMKIGELERVSGTPRSTIRHYENLGLLPPPEVRGAKLHLFGPEHVACLLEIKRLRKSGTPLRDIKPLLTRSVHAQKRRRKPTVPTPTEERIVAYATNLFLTRGYDRVRLDDLAADLRVAKATLYRHFESKQELFVRCVQQMRYTLVSKEERQRSEQRGTATHSRDRVVAVLMSFEKFRRLTHLLSSLSEQSEDPVLAERTRAALHEMITNAEPHLRQQREAKLIRPFDTELLAYMLWGALMGAGDLMMRDQRYSTEQLTDTYLDFVQHGISAKPKS